MAFVNERIPRADFERFRFSELDERPKEHSGTTPSNAWTIDRESNMWLRKFYAEMDHTESDGGYTGISVWDFYWKGVLMLTKIRDVGIGGGYGQPRWQSAELISINIPEQLAAERATILANLEAAFVAYKGAGIFATDEDYSFTLNGKEI